MSKTAINDLQVLIRKLQDQRQTHLGAIADIDEAFKSLGIQPPKQRGRRRGAKKTTGATKGAARKTVGKKKVAKKGPRKFKTTAGELVMAVIKKAGTTGATGAQIAKAWRTAGRPRDAYNALGELVKAKTIKRQQVKGQRGSLYVVG